MSQFPFPACPNIQELYDYDSVFDFLGSGEFATVYKATRRVTSNNMMAGEEVALKILPKSKIDSEKAAKAITSEVENLRRIKHRNCVVLREALQSDREVYMVLALVKDAGELFQVVSGTALSEQCAATITKQILRAVRYLHVDRRVVHRDLKPENIMISPKKCGAQLLPEDIKVTLVDFGLSKYIGSNQRKKAMPRPVIGNASNYMNPPRSAMLSFPSTESMESVGSHTNSPVLTTPVGTLRYSAPETLRGIMENGGSPRQTTRGNLQKVDLYSIGIIAHIMLCGQMPFSGRTKPQLASQMESGAKFTASQWQKVTPEAKDFVQQLLFADPQSRLSAEQALRHPWIVQMALKDEEDVGKPLQKIVSYDSVDNRTVGASPSDSVTFEPLVTNRNDLNNAFTEMLQQEAQHDDDDAPPPLPPQRLTQSHGHFPSSEGMYAPRGVSVVSQPAMRPPVSNYFGYLASEPGPMDVEGTSAS